MSNHPIDSLMTTAMENLKDMIEANTIIGDPIETPDGGTIIPVSKVGFGFAAGGSDLPSGQQHSEDPIPFAGGSGGGVSVSPVAFLVITKDGSIKMVHLDEHTHIYEKLIDKAPETIEKLQKALKDALPSSESKQQKSDQGGSRMGSKRRQDRHDDPYEI
ncbi:GerW family sporulation protein [Aciduricibacillus chroicocephali]|uniref:GerW family sporulation protein n=1 Tax=Aciduricibacillus chroicocephali TaxID=3054939 RepID=A0ABY9KSU2_9BACI|nr:GerW family sporulation protein [Bacillaceae bacterium 44XB]